MKKIIILAIFSLYINCVFAQLSIPNIDFSVEENSRMTVSGGAGYVSFKYELKNSMTRGALIKLIEEKLKDVMYNWLTLAFYNDYEIGLDIQENNTGETRRFIFLSTYNRSAIVITQVSQATNVQVYNVVGGGETIPTMEQEIILDGSEEGVKYNLYQGDVKISTQIGTGEKLIFTGSFSGNYYVQVEKDGLERRMNGMAQFKYFTLVLGDNMSLHNRNITIRPEGDVISIPFIFHQNYEDCWSDLRAIVKACNDEKVKSWNKEHQLYLSVDANRSKGMLHIIGSPNISPSARTSNLYLGPQNELIVNQEPGGSVEIFNVYGNGNLILGQKTSIHLDGSQRVNYYLYRNGNRVSGPIIGSGKVVTFGNVTIPVNYSIKAECDGQTFDMNGSVLVRDININPPYVREETKTGDGIVISDITYYDGSARPLQQVNVGASPGGKDLVAPVVRDGVGREAVSYLPFAINGNGNYRSQAVVEQNTFFTSLYGNNPMAYTSRRFNNGPDDRVIEQSAPGYSWRLDGGHTTRFSYRKNIASDKVKRYILEGSSVRLDTEYWPAESLSVKEVTGTQGDVMLEYCDVQGNLVAKESRLINSKRLFTYEVRDVQGRLRYVIPPLQDSLFTTGTKSLSELSKYCYYTEYDEYGRVYKQYHPGAGYVLNLYDKRGRLVFVQDGKQRTNGTWSFTKYDDLDRPVISGICTGTEAGHKAGLQSQTIFGEQRGTTLHGYTNQTYPTNVVTKDCYIITYYDDYNWSGQSAVAYSTADAIGGVKSNDVLGLVTGTKTKVLGVTTDQWLLSAEYYDQKYRSIQSVMQLYPSGTEITSNTHDFAGQVTRAKVKQTIGSLVTEYNKYFTYDQRGRVLKIEQQITGDNSNGRVTLVENVYDELGRVSSGKLHNGKEIQSYGYNVNGSVASVSSSAFSYTLNYDQVNVTGASARYDGNINAMTWKNGSGTEKAYVYSYDPLGQLEAASYKEKSGSGWLNSTGKYNVSGLSYDLNGNMKSIRRNNGSGATLHAINYTYGITNNGNAISRIALNNTSSGTYVYDENGNMTTDGHRGVTITYNNLDLPSEISKGQTKISYIYSAKGEKLAQKVTTTEGSSLTYYRGVMVYNGNTLDYILHPAGVTRKASSGYVYDYFLTDHLGSTRVVLEASGNTLVPIQTTEYYPFGLAFMTNNLDKNKRLFSGKEMQNVTFGNEMLGMYDFGSRFYDPLLSRWFCQDPASQLVCPYGYCGNNPVMFVDPNGEFAWLAFGIGAALGAWTGGTLANDGQMNPGKWDWKSEKTWGYMFGGAAIGGASGALGGTIAAEGGFMANTGSIMASSFTNSFGMSVMTGGEMLPSISFGVASFDFGSGFNYLGKKGNKWLQNLGYALGVYANMTDMWAVIKGAYNSTGMLELQTDSHSQTFDYEYNKLFSWGAMTEDGKRYFPEDATFRERLPFALKKLNPVTDYNSVRSKLFRSVPVKRVNLGGYRAYVESLPANGQSYRFATLLPIKNMHCTIAASRALLAGGVFNLPILRMPWLLDLQMRIRDYTFLGGHLIK